MYEESNMAHQPDEKEVLNKIKQTLTGKDNISKSIYLGDNLYMTLMKDGRNKWIMHAFKVSRNRQDEMVTTYL